MGTRRCGREPPRYLRLAVDNGQTQNAALCSINTEAEFSLKQLQKVTELESTLAMWALGGVKLPDMLRRDLHRTAIILGGLRLILLSAMAATDDVEIVGL